jgi:hypothetical protein
VLRDWQIQKRLWRIEDRIVAALYGDTNDLRRPATHLDEPQTLANRIRSQILIRERLIDDGNPR